MFTQICRDLSTVYYLWKRNTDLETLLCLKSGYLKNNLC